ncbi:MAG: hypothetical protein ABEJ56_00745 [Candidatus Nanohaloarchaea archaeon]
MASLWDIGKSTEEKLADELKSNGEFQEMVDQHREKFEPRFEDNMKEEVPTHPYKIYRNIVEQNELSDEEKVALEKMKDEFSEKWQTLKNSQSN